MVMGHNIRTIMSPDDIDYFSFDDYQDTDNDFGLNALTDTDDTVCDYIQNDCLFF